MCISHLNQAELAFRWRISPRTLERWRWSKTGPVYLKIGGRVIYRLEDIETFEKASIRLSSSHVPVKWSFLAGGLIGIPAAPSLCQEGCGVSGRGSDATGRILRLQTSPQARFRPLSVFRLWSTPPAFSASESRLNDPGV